MATSQAGNLKFAKFDISTATTTTIVAALTNASIIVVGLVFCMSGTTPTMKVQDGAGTALTGTFDLAGVYPLMGSDDFPLMSTAANQGLQIVTTGTPSVRGFVTYYSDNV